MQEIKIKRGKSTKYGTFGILTMPDGKTTFHTLELPNHNNEVRKSCIPLGEYTCKIVYSPKFKADLYEVTKVNNRSNILFHWGNWAADKSFPSLKSDVFGCILLGTGKVDNLMGQPAVTNSKKAIVEFMKIMEFKPFKLTIE